MDWKDEFRQKLADAGVEMFQKPSLDELISMAKEWKKLKAQSTKYSFDDLLSMAKELEKLKVQDPDASKKFTLKHTFNNVSKMVEGEQKGSPMEYHFDVPWYVEVEHRNDKLAVFLWCKRNSDIPWSVQCAIQVQIIHPSGKTTSQEIENVFGLKSAVKCWWFMKWEEMKKEYLVGDQLTVVVNVAINKMTGIS